jgi:hypothetical protein
VRFRNFFGPEVFIVTLPYTEWKMRFDADPYVLWQKNQSNKCTELQNMTDFVARVNLSSILLKVVIIS